MATFLQTKNECTHIRRIQEELVNDVISQLWVALHCWGESKISCMKICCFTLGRSDIINLYDNQPVWR